MAIYHYSVGIISRSKGRSATAAAAYRAGEKIEDIRTGEIHDYRKKKGVDEKFILAPVQAPDWVYNRQKLWNEVELGERRKDSQLSREINVAIPVELSKVQQVELVKGFVQKQFVNEGMVADVAFHNLSSHNPHAHIMLTMREIEPDGFSKTKQTAWNRRELLEKQREAWAVHTNRALELAGINEKIDHRRNEAQGINEIPQIHLGANVNAMMKRGIATERGERYHAIAEANRNIRRWEFHLALAEEMESIYRKSPDLSPTVKSPANPKFSAEDIEPTQHNNDTPTFISYEEELDLEEIYSLTPGEKTTEKPEEEISSFLPELEQESTGVTTPQLENMIRTTSLFLHLVGENVWNTRDGKYHLMTDHKNLLVIKALDNRGEIIRYEDRKIIAHQVKSSDVELFAKAQTWIDSKLKEFSASSDIKPTQEQPELEL